MRLMVSGLIIASASLLGAAPTPGQGSPPTDDGRRAIRRTIPMTNTIRRAHAAGTRDSSGAPGPRYWQNRVDYDIRARLDVPTNTVGGRARIVIHNESDTTLSTIHLRLDQNINAPHAPRLNPRPVDGLTAGMRVRAMSIDGRPVTIVPPKFVPGSSALRLPAAYALHTTNGFLRLDEPIARGGRAILEVEWSFEVPPEGAIRMGRIGDSLYQVAQWYPRVAVYDDLRGWDIDPYMGSAEFYNNFGHFEVRLDVPGGWLVGATGTLVNAAAVLSAQTRARLSRALVADSVVAVVSPSDRGAGRATATGERLTWHFVADSVSDFAWAASRSYVWDATRATIGDRTVPVHLLYQPGRASLFTPAAAVSRHALEFYSQLWFPYPFAQLTLADGPELGMEYPMFIMSAIQAADHEVGHQWWPMVVSNNETWYGWMDEGFNQYMNIFSENAFAHRTPSLVGIGRSYGTTSGAELESPMMWPANHQGAYYGFTTYMKTPAMLSMLGGIVGDSAVHSAMRAWANAWRFKHPSPWDFMFFMNRALGRDLDWFWYYWLFTTEATHGSIVSVTSPRSGSTSYTVIVKQDGEMPAPVVLQARLAPGQGQVRLPANARMTDSSTVTLTWPVDVWFGGARTFTAAVDLGRAVESFRLDPDGRFPDRDSRDNGWPR